METYLRTMDEILEEMTEEYQKNTGFRKLPNQLTQIGRYASIMRMVLAW